MGRPGKVVFVTMLGAALLLWGGASLRSLVQRGRAAQRVQSKSQLKLRPCDVPGTNGALCGTYEVFEDRAAKSGRKIGLNLVVLPALGPHPQPDSVFWLHGGPGAAATETARFLDRSFLGPLRQDRDMVFVDQRGTGQSNGLYCDFADDPADPKSFFGEMFPLDRVRECREKLDKVANLKLYTTPIAMDDLDEVRAALGYDKINLVAASYGTFAAQVYLRQHGKHVRAAFLGGVASLNIKQPLLFARAAQNALELLYRDCASDAECHAAFPDLQKEFEAVLARFEKGPVEAQVADPKNGEKRTLAIARGNYVEYMRLALYTTAGARYVPLVVHRAYLNDYAPFAAMAARFSLGSTVARGMYMTVTCSEGVPFISEEDIVRESKGTFVGKYRVLVHQEACQEWPRGDIPKNYIEPVQSDVPVLLISGEADGSTLPRYGQEVVKSLSHARQVMVPHYGHQINSLCVIGMLEDFIRKGTTDGLDTSCAASTQRPPFVTQLPPQLAGQ